MSARMVFPNLNALQKEIDGNQNASMVVGRSRVADRGKRIVQEEEASDGESDGSA